MPASERTVDIKCGWLFPFHFLFLGGGILLGGIGVMLTYPVIGTVLIIAGAVMLTAQEGTEINPATHIYREYNSFLFIKTGSGKRYQGLEKIFINPVKLRQGFYAPHGTASTSITYVEYNAYLKFSDGARIFLVSGKNKKKLIRDLSEVARRLNIPLQDNTAVAH